MRLNTCRPSAVIVFRTFWTTLISVIFLEKLLDLRLGPMTLFQQPMLRFYPAALVVLCGHLPVHAAVAADLGNVAIPNGRITAFFGGGITTSRVSPYPCLSISRVDAPS